MFLETAVNLTSLETDSDSAWQPGAFLRHGVNIDSRDLDWRTGDGRHWTVELSKTARKYAVKAERMDERGLARAPRQE